MKVLQKKLRQACVVLDELSGKPQRRVYLERQLSREGGTHFTFDNIFFFLVQDGYIQKLGPEIRSPYCITEKGKSFLEVLTWA